MLRRAAQGGNIQKMFKNPLSKLAQNVKTTMIKKSSIMNQIRPKW